MNNDDRSRALALGLVQPELFDYTPPLSKALPKKQKTDYAALESSFMRIPRMKPNIARVLLDIGLTEVYQLIGRSPESLLEDYKKHQSIIPQDLIAYLRLAVYFASTPDPDPKKLHPTHWVHTEL